MVNGGAAMLFETGLGGGGALFEDDKILLDLCSSSLSDSERPTSGIPFRSGTVTKKILGYET